MTRMTRLTMVLLLPLAAMACATAARDPLVDIPAGNYVMVEPEPGVYTAVAINERGFSRRMGADVQTGQHWVDPQGRLHITDDAGPCAGEESLWTYEYTGDRMTLTLIDDRCEVRPEPLPLRVVYERI